MNALGQVSDVVVDGHDTDAHSLDVIVYLKVLEVEELSVNPVANGVRSADGPRSRGKPVLVVEPILLQFVVKWLKSAIVLFVHEILKLLAILLKVAQIVAEQLILVICFEFFQI